MSMSNKIRKLRFDNGEITQKELADLVGVSRQTMNAIENNKHAPTIDVAIRIADVFREDTPQPSLDRREALAAAPNADDECYRVPAVLGDV